jgi:hypothetical protein
MFGSDSSSDGEWRLKEADEVTFCGYRGEVFGGSANLPNGTSQTATLGSKAASLALDVRRLEFCGRDSRLEFSSSENRFRAGIDEVNIQPVTSVLIHAPEPE